MVSERASQGAFFSVAALVFAASAAVTIVRCASMSAMDAMPMPGSWTMSMAWSVVAANPCLEPCKAMHTRRRVRLSGK
jgi:hypothetical protein